MAGSMAKCRSSHIRRGRVIAPEPDMNNATISSSSAQDLPVHIYLR